jgi:hypothetical protein
MTTTKLKKVLGNSVDYSNAAIKFTNKNGITTSFCAYKIDGGTTNVSYIDKNNNTYKYKFYNEMSLEGIKAISFVNIAESVEDTETAKYCFYAFQVHPYLYNDINTLSFYNYKDTNYTKLNTVKPTINYTTYAYYYYGLNSTHDLPVIPGENSSQFLLGDDKRFNYNIYSSSFINPDSMKDKLNRYAQIGFYTTTILESPTVAAETVRVRKLFIYNPYNHEISADNITVSFSFIYHGEKHSYSPAKKSIPAYGYLQLESIGWCSTDSTSYPTDSVDVSESNPITVKWRLTEEDTWNTYKITNSSYSHYIEIKGVDTTNKKITVNCNEYERAKFYYLYNIKTGTPLEVKYVTNCTDGTVWDLSVYETSDSTSSFLLSDANSWEKIFNDFDTYKTVYISFEDWDSLTELEG